MGYEWVCELVGALGKDDGIVVAYLGLGGKAGWLAVAFERLLPGARKRWDGWGKGKEGRLEGVIRILMV